MRRFPFVGLAGFGRHALDMLTLSLYRYAALHGTQVVLCDDLSTSPPVVTEEVQAQTRIFALATNPANCDRSRRDFLVLEEAHCGCVGRGCVSWMGAVDVCRGCVLWMCAVDACCGCVSSASACAYALFYRQSYIMNTSPWSSAEDCGCPGGQTRLGIVCLVVLEQWT